MEVIKYSRKEMITLFSTQLKLNEIIEQVEKMAQIEGKVVCRIKVNGMSFSEADETRFASTEKKEIDEIEVHLESLSVLLTESANSICDYMVKIRAMSVIASEKFREGINNDSRETLTQIIDGIQWVVSALNLLKPNLLNCVSSKKCPPSDWEPAEVHLLKTVKELKQAFERQDFVLVSDVLEYELCTSLEMWIEIIRSKY